jgi:hypothetical protein
VCVVSGSRTSTASDLLPADIMYNGKIARLSSLNLYM